MTFELVTTEVTNYLMAFDALKQAYIFLSSSIKNFLQKSHPGVFEKDKVGKTPFKRRVPVTTLSTAKKRKPDISCSSFMSYR